MIGTAIYSLVSSVGRVYPVRASQGEPWPFVVYNITNMTPIGTKASPSVIDVYRVQFTIYSEQYADLDTYDDAIRVILDGYSGIQDSIEFDSVRLEVREDGFDNSAGYYARAITYKARVFPNLTT